MLIAVSANDTDLDSAISPIFGRCRYFLLVDSETLSAQSLANPAVGAAGGAGVQAAQFIVEQSVQALITGNVGPNAFAVLQPGGVAVYAHTDGTVRQAVEALAAGSLTPVMAATGPSHVGMARGVGGGRRRNW
jgi:predicted Fe-Mo cluster-binding NifX family protein